MAEQKLLFKRGTKAALEAKLVGTNKPALGEPIYEVPEANEEVVSAKLKIGDGVSNYADLPYVGGSSPAPSSATIYQADCPKGADHATVIATICPNPVAGDIVIVKELIYDNKRQYTAYIYNGTAWVAMDGNYSAENVFLAADITLAGDYTQVGNITKGQKEAKVLDVKGKSVAAVLTEIFSKRLQPGTPTQPAVTIAGYQGNQDLEIGTSVSVNGTLTSALSKGSYEYGPADTGITPKTWASEVKYTTGKSGTIIQGTTDSTAYSYNFTLGADNINTVAVNFKATATYDDGVVAKDNLGDDSNPAVKIYAGSKSKDVTATYTCYRKMFCGTRTDKSDLDSTKIRALTGIKEAAKASNSWIAGVPVGAMRVIFAVPANRTITSIKNENAMGAEALSSFEVSNINVEGANGFTAAAYKVYVLNYAEPNDTANKYKATVV